MDKISLARKRELQQPDEVQLFLNKVLEYVIDNKMQLVSGIGILLFSVIVVYGLSYYKTSNENKASILFDDVKQKYVDTLKTKSVADAYKEVKANYTKYFAEYSSTSAGKFAQIQFANISYDSGNFDKAIEFYELAIDEFGKDHPFGNLLLSGIAYSFAGKKNYESAIKYFNELVLGTSEVMKDDALFNLGLIYEKQGEKEKSADVFKKIVADYTNSIFIKIVTEKLAS